MKFQYKELKYSNPQIFATCWCSHYIIWFNRIYRWTYLGLRHWVLKILGLENQSFWQRLNSFHTNFIYILKNCITINRMNCIIYEITWLFKIQFSERFLSILRIVSHCVNLYLSSLVLFCRLLPETRNSWFLVSRGLPVYQ